MSTPAAVFTIRHRKALVQVLTEALTHGQLDELAAAHPVPGDPGHDAGKEGRVELIVLTLMEEPDQPGLLTAATLVRADELTEPTSRQWQMLTRRMARTGHPLPVVDPTPTAADETPAAPEPVQVHEEAPAAGAPAVRAQQEDSRGVPGRRAVKKHRMAERTRRHREEQQMVAVGGTAELVAQLRSLEGVQVVHVEDVGTRAQALAVLEVVSTALQTPGALVAVAGPVEMTARATLHG